MPGNQPTIRPTILVTGANGQLGSELAVALAAHGAVVACDRATLDLTNASRIVEVVRDLAPQLIVNAGAYTAVDRAETERELAFAVNARAPGILAEEARRSGAVLIHYSTDYVFDGAATRALRRAGGGESAERLWREQARRRACRRRDGVRRR